MSVHNISVETNRFASEIAMSGAPAVRLNNGKEVIPQHYLRFNQTIHSISEILLDIECDPSILLFAGEESDLMFIQAGIIGMENYPGEGVSLAQKKLVYGRKWFIRSDTPTSEVIQTAMLAIKKLREHEVRELITITDFDTGRQSAAFSSHQDLPMMAENRELLSKTDNKKYDSNLTINQILDHVEFDHRTFKIIDMDTFSNQLVVKMSLEQSHPFRKECSTIKEFEKFECTLILDTNNGEQLLYELMNSLIAYSDRFVEENFTYQGFKRFSRENSPLGIAALSIATRQYVRDLKDKSFAKTFKQENFATDAGRTPALGVGRLAVKNKTLLEQYRQLDGHLPHGFIEPLKEQSSDFFKLSQTA